MKDLLSTLFRLKSHGPWKMDKAYTGILLLGILLTGLTLGCTPVTDSNPAFPKTDSPAVYQTEEGPSNNEVSSPVKLMTGTVTRVVDGDTAIIALSGGREERVRFIGVDTPESTTRHEPFGQEASSYTKAQLTGKTVYLELDVDERDKYGRILAYIWLSPPTRLNHADVQAKMFNARLLQEGYAQVMTIQPNSKYADEFVTYQREARKASKGLWALAAGTTTGATSSMTFGTISGTASPNNGRSPSAAIGSSGVSADEKSEVVYVTNTGSKYHRDGCRYLKQSRVPMSLKDARAAYDPCRVCNPPK